MDIVWFFAFNEIVLCSLHHIWRHRGGQVKQAHGFKGNSETCISCSTLICRVCKVVKDAAAFASPMLQSFKKKKCNMLRCNACHTCEKCERAMRACSFEGASPTCKRCMTITFEAEKFRAA